MGHYFFGHTVIFMFQKPNLIFFTAPLVVDTISIRVGFWIGIPFLLKWVPILHPYGNLRALFTS